MSVAIFDIRPVGAQRLMASLKDSLEGALVVLGQVLGVLNAGWHHGRIHTEGSGATDRGATVLNAGWHHGRIHLVIACNQNDRRVLNAGWHHGRIHPDGKLRQLYRYIVLNAGWHHGRIHLSTAGPLVPSGATCSTPDGITEGFTRRGRCDARWTAVLNAGWHHGRIHTNRNHGAGPRLRVLNAGWHHGRIHSSAPARWCPHGGSAQRLMASLKDSRPSRRQSVRQASGAQRLMASLKDSRQAVRWAGTGVIVLNAGWHHGRIHPTAGPTPGSSREVLNAGWHHGRIHMTPLLEDLAGYRCSTPDGITEGFTLRAALTVSRSSRAQRLMASLKDSRKVIGQADDEITMCSTPDGITEGFTMATAPPSLSVTGAQRLMASLKDSHR